MIIKIINYEVEIIKSIKIIQDKNSKKNKLKHKIISEVCYIVV